ncbi:zinc finger protein 596-like [Chanos chanos]|uniref:Zinc finger protein 596-like n=1 Tax=Chanos chanos TaxID=29144 RepID=A0A6J2VHZ9_CHACN|nr:zinc finger protein 596-like [Chanos chanos]
MSSVTVEKAQMYPRSMSKIDRLNARVAKLLTVAVHEVLEVVRETVSEYQEKTARTQRENEKLRLKLRDALEKLEKEKEASRHATVFTQQQPCEQSWSSCIGQNPESSWAKDRPVKAEISLDQTDREDSSRSEPSQLADPETVCDLSVAFTLAEQKKVPSESRSNTALPPFTPPSIKQVETIDTISTVNVTLPKSQTPNTSCTDVLPSVATDDIKTEPDISDYPASPQHVPQSGFDFAEDLSAASARQESDASNAKTSEGSGSYGLYFIHTNHSPIGRRFSYGRAVRTTLDSRRHKQGQRREEQHICVICGKTFSRVGNLRIHQRCHTGEKPYRCLQCGRCFSQAGDLKKHKRVHTGEKPYYCGQCGKSFSRGENLKRHQKIHIGETLQLQQGGSWRDPQIN